MLNDLQQKNYVYFTEHLNEWLEDPLKVNKYAVIQGEEIKGLYDTFESAFQFAYGAFPDNDYVIQQIIDKTEIIEFLRSAVV